MSVALKKNPAVEKVNVSLNKGLATISLKEKNNASIQQFRQAIKEKGFTPKDAQIKAIATISLNRDEAYAAITGSSDIFKLSTTPDSKNLKLQSFHSKTVVIQGRIPEPSRDHKIATLQVIAIRPMIK